MAMNALQIEIPLQQIERFCTKWHVVEFALFGSVLRPDFRPDSDIDVLLTFDPQHPVSLFDRVDMIEELMALFGRPVDLVNRRGLERSFNEGRKKAILESAQVIHRAA